MQLPYGSPQTHRIEGLPLIDPINYNRIIELETREQVEKLFQRGTLIFEESPARHNSCLISKATSDLSSTSMIVEAPVIDFIGSSSRLHMSSSRLHISKESSKPGQTLKSIIEMDSSKGQDEKPLIEVKQDSSEKSEKPPVTQRSMQKTLETVRSAGQIKTQQKSDIKTPRSLEVPQIVVKDPSKQSTPFNSSQKVPNEENSKDLRKLKKNQQDREILKVHDKKYNKAKVKIDRDVKNFKMIKEITDTLVENRIFCYKYNYSLDETVQNFCCFDAFLELQQDQKNIHIINRKPVEDNEYVLEADPEKVKEAEEYHQNQIKQLEKAKKYYSPVEMDNDRDFKHQKSSTSCNVDDIQGFIFGGISSRFWLLRKHFCSLKREELKDLPFYCWECITLQLSNRDVDLVIRDETQMDQLLLYLIHNMRTMDGKRDSANNMLDLMSKQIKKTQQNGEKITYNELKEIKKQQEHMLFRKILLKYKIMRIRAKISFIALEKRMTIYELFISTIQRTFIQLQRIGLIPQDSFEVEVRNDKMFQRLLRGEIRGFFNTIIEFNWEHIQGTRFEKKILEIKNQFKIEETVKVYKNDECVEHKIDHEQNECKVQAINNIINKNKCSDILMELQNKVNNKSKAKLDHEAFVKKKFMIKDLALCLMKLQMCTRMLAVHGLVFLRAYLKKIEISKLLFLSEIEDGLETFIPAELAQNHLPFSFKYYDPILAIVQENVSKERREFFTLKQEVACSIHRKSDLKQQMLEKFGIVDVPSEKTAKLTFQHQVVNKKSKREINHNHSMHPMALQRSKYIVVDDNIEKEAVLKNLSLGTKNDHESLNIRFCPDDEVCKKRQKFFVQKTQFYIKMNHLKSRGQKLELTEKLEEFIEENIEKFYENPNVEKKMKKIFGEEKTKQIDALIQKKSKYGQKVLIQKQLLEYAESLLIKRRNKLRLMRVKSMNKNTQMKIPMRQRDNFIEQKIDVDIRYFSRVRNNCNDLIDFDKLRVQLRKNNEILEKRDEQIRSHRSKILSARSALRKSNQKN